MQSKNYLLHRYANILNIKYQTKVLNSDEILIVGHNTKKELVRTVEIKDYNFTLFVTGMILTSHYYSDKPHTDILNMSVTSYSSAFAQWLQEPILHHHYHNDELVFSLKRFYDQRIFATKVLKQRYAAIDAAKRGRLSYFKGKSAIPYPVNLIP